MNTAHRVEISSKTIFFIIFLIAALSLIWQLRSLIFLFFVCFIFSEAINHPVSQLEKFKIPRFLSVIIIYLLIISSFSFAVSGILPNFIEQTKDLVNTLPSLLSQFKPFGFSLFDITSQLNILDSLPSNIAKAVFSVASNIFSFFIILIITFYLLMERKNIPSYALKLFGPVGEDHAKNILISMETKLGAWVNAELILMVTIALLSYFGYLAIGIKYAVPLAIIAGLLEIIPNIGPTVAGALAAIIAYATWPPAAIFTIIWMIIIQQLENTYIVPKIMKEAVGIHPLATIFLLAAGAKLAGVVGALLAVPAYLIVQSFTISLLSSKNRLQR
ncbi:MAG: AI-2E family transporter [Candidatus Shapirobacteria bacterium]|jgi:predicted PurR-regulated permease PerM